MRFLLLTALVACNGGTPELCEENAAQTYDNFGSGFFTENCQSCHASMSEERQGAPVEVFFDDEEDVWTHSDRILDRAVTAGSMPPLGGISDDDRLRLQVMLECGG